MTTEFIAGERKSGEVDIIPIVRNGESIRVDVENIVTIGYGNNVVENKFGDVTVTNF